MPMRHKNSRPATQQGGNITEYFAFFYCLLDRGHFMPDAAVSFVKKVTENGLLIF